MPSIPADQQGILQVVKGEELVNNGEQLIGQPQVIISHWGLVPQTRASPQWFSHHLHFLVTSVTTKQPLKRGWSNTRGWSMDFPSWSPQVTRTVKLLWRRLEHQALQLPLLCLQLRKQAGKFLAWTAKMMNAQPTAVKFTNVLDVKWSSTTMMTWTITC